MCYSLLSNNNSECTTKDVNNRDDINRINDSNDSDDNDDCVDNTYK